MVPVSYQPFLRNGEGSLVNGNIKVNGMCTLKVKPDEVVIQLGVITRNKSAISAQRENAVSSSNLINALLKFGIDKKYIQTILYTVHPTYKIIDNQQILEGFEVSHQIEVTLKNVNNVGEVYDLAFSSGANYAQGLFFQVSDPSKYIQQALSLAVKDSILKAQTIANAVRSHIHTIPIKITEMAEMRPIRLRQETFMATMATPIMIRDVEIIARVESEFSYL